MAGTAKIGALCFAAFFAAQPAPSSANYINIENMRGEKVKFCTYRSDDESLIRERKCWMLRKNQKMRWNRGNAPYRFDVRLFEPGAFELPICMRRAFGEIYRVEISPRKTKKCVTALSRSFLPAQQWQKNDRVMANRAGDNHWYPATVLGRDAGRYRLRYADGRDGLEKAGYIGDDIIVTGARVESSWKNFGRWLPGYVESRDGDYVVIAYDNGITERVALAYVRVATVAE